MTLPVFLHAPQSFNTPLHDDLTAYQPLLGRWLIDLALLLGWDRPKRADRLCELLEDEEFLAMTGLPEVTVDDFPETPTTASFRTQMTQRLKQRRQVLAQITLDPNLPLIKNLNWLKDLLGLHPADQAVLCFAVFLRDDSSFRNVIRYRCSSVSTAQLCQVLARLTDLPPKDIRAALKPTGLLLSTGLVELRKHTADLEGKLEPRDDLATIMFNPHDDAEALMACFVKPSPPRTLTLTNFPYLAADTLAVQGLLRAVLANRSKGTNILLYGPPGVGKTEYAVALAATVGAELYEVDYADEDGDPIRGERRLHAFNLCQRLLARRDNALLLFDEVEDMFEYDPLARLFGGQGAGAATAGKAWINRSLENNPVPAIWITNDADSLDPAYRRRFDDAIRFAVPPKTVRLAIARHHLGAWAGDDDWLAHLAAHAELTPAQLERAAKVARHAGNGDLDRNRDLVRQALDRSATLLNQKRLPAHTGVSTGYDLRFINTDQNLPKLIAALKRRPRGNFCFYGPAGTGKSELARYLAESLDKPLLLKRGSDLLSPFVGETEREIAAMFSEARQQDAVLLLDEVDSFLRDRRGAQRSWEVTQVNELLTQMESFDGIFICTTNLMDSLDPACLRRFPWKIRFQWLTPAQRWALFAQTFARLGGDLTSILSWEPDVRRLECLTPGDVAAVVRQYELWDEIPSAGDLYARLRVELATKALAHQGDKPVNALTALS